MPDIFQINSKYRPLAREIGLDAEAVFSHPLVKPWRFLPDRENCTLDATVDGMRVRLHVKRYTAARPSTADAEVAGQKLLDDAGIPTAELAGWGRLEDGRSFTMFADLSAHQASDNAVVAGMSFDRLLEPTALLAAKLHKAGLHHRDLYLCHFMTDADVTDVRLIDVARVRKLPTWFSQRWIIKDLAQFWFSTLKHPGITDAHRDLWLKRYAGERKIDPNSLKNPILRKVARITMHDRRLNTSQPMRNVSIPK